jgi:hypothetical protein
VSPSSHVGKVQVLLGFVCANGRCGLQSHIKAKSGTEAEKPVEHFLLPCAAYVSVFFAS